MATRKAAAKSAPKKAPKPTQRAAAAPAVVDTPKATERLAREAKVEARHEKNADEAGARPGDKIRVRARLMGYTPDNQRKRPGDVFVIDAALFSSRWMQRVPDKTRTRVTGPQAALNARRAELKGGSTRPVEDDDAGGDEDVFGDD